MRSESESKRLLVQFDEPQVVQDATKWAFGQFRVATVPAMVLEAISEGLVAVFDSDGPVQPGLKVYSRMLLLTESGRAFCGLPPVVAETPRIAKKPQRGLFDDDESP